MPNIFNRSFTSADRDADVIRQRLAPIVNYFTEGTPMEDPANQRKLANASVKVVEITATLAAVAAAIPGVAGRLLAGLVVGMEKEPGTGKMSPGVQTGMNFAPSPIGFMDPKAVGIKPNFYLPEGSTNYIPDIADRVGLGLPEQRKEDAVANDRNFNAKWNAQILTARKKLLGESDETLRDIVNGPRPLSRAAVVVADERVHQDIFRIEALRELTLRAQGARDPLPELARTTADAIAALTAEQRAVLQQLIDAGRALDARQARLRVETQAALDATGGPLDPFATPIRGGSIVVSRIRPATGPALANAEAAEGIRRELVTELIDP